MSVSDVAGSNRTARYAWLSLLVTRTRVASLVYW